MAKETDLMKKAEEVFGRELAAEALDRIRLTIRISSYNYITDNVYVASTNIILPGKWCNYNPVFEIGGVAATRSDGKRVFRLREFSCIGQITFDHPVNVVATPLSSQPFFLTVIHALVLPDPNNSNLNDVEITVFAWDANGNAAPNIAFDWRCRVPYWELIL
jgi:hypothetical protein